MSSRRENDLPPMDGLQRASFSSASTPIPPSDNYPQQQPQAVYPPPLQQALAEFPVGQSPPTIRAHQPRDQRNTAGTNMQSTSPSPTNGDGLMTDYNTFSNTFQGASHQYQPHQQPQQPQQPAQGSTSTIYPNLQITFCPGIPLTPVLQFIPYDKCFNLIHIDHHNAPIVKSENCAFCGDPIKSAPHIPGQSWYHCTRRCYFCKNFRRKGEAFCRCLYSTRPKFCKTFRWFKAVPSPAYIRHRPTEDEHRLLLAHGFIEAPWNRDEFPRFTERALKCLDELPQFQHTACAQPGYDITSLTRQATYAHGQKRKAEYDPGLQQPARHFQPRAPDQRQLPRGRTPQLHPPPPSSSSFNPSLRSGEALTRWPHQPAPPYHQYSPYEAQPAALSHHSAHPPYPYMQSQTPYAYPGYDDRRSHTPYELTQHSPYPGPQYPGPHYHGPRYAMDSNNPAPNPSAYDTPPAPQTRQPTSTWYPTQMPHPAPMQPQPAPVLHHKSPSHGSYNQSLTYNPVSPASYSEYPRENIPYSQPRWSQRPSMPYSTRRFPRVKSEENSQDDTPWVARNISHNENLANDPVMKREHLSSSPAMRQEEPLAHKPFIKQELHD